MQVRIIAKAITTRENLQTCLLQTSDFLRHSFAFCPRGCPSRSCSKVLFGGKGGRVVAHHGGLPLIFRFWFVLCETWCVILRFTLHVLPMNLFPSCDGEPSSSSTFWWNLTGLGDLSGLSQLSPCAVFPAWGCVPQAGRLYTIGWFSLVFYGNGQRFQIWQVQRTFGQ